MSPLRFYLARHGRTPWNQLGRFQGHTDIPLDDVGRAQALQLAESLRGRIGFAFSSDMLRASETARLVCDALDIPLLALDSDLRERGYGVFEGLTREECAARFPEAWAARELDRNHEPPGGEPRAQVIGRMQAAMARALEVLRAQPDTSGAGRGALVVGHGSSLRMLLELVTGAEVASIGNMECRLLLHDGEAFRLATDQPRT
jgi:broad specificity phosphatase PhoE